MTRFGTASLYLALALALAGCRKKEGPFEDTPSGAPPASAGVTRCGAAILKGIKATTVREAMSSYYAECADMHQRPLCADAWRAASKAEPGTEMPALAEACTKAYCSDLGAYSLELCKADFNGTGPALEKAWGPFFNAVVEREAGEYAGHLATGLMVFYAHTKQLDNAEKAANPPQPAPPSSVSGVPAPSASAAPSPSGEPAKGPAAAPPGAPQPATSAK